MNTDPGAFRILLKKHLKRNLSVSCILEQDIDNKEVFFFNAYSE